MLRLRKGDKICQWDPFNAVIIAEDGGIIQYESIEEGLTFRIERDDVTGYAEKVIVESKEQEKDSYYKNSITIWRRVKILQLTSRCLHCGR